MSLPRMKRSRRSSPRARAEIWWAIVGWGWVFWVFISLVMLLIVAVAEEGVWRLISGKGDGRIADLEGG